MIIIYALTRGCNESQSIAVNRTWNKFSISLLYCIHFQENCFVYISTVQLECFLHHQHPFFLLMNSQFHHLKSRLKLVCTRQVANIIIFKKGMLLQLLSQNNLDIMS